jgi:hypothetical protein
MPGCVAVDPHEAVILTFCYFDDAVKIPSLEKRVKNKLVFSFPMLPAEGSVRELHVIWSLDVVIGEGEWSIVPGVVSILEPRAKVDDLGSGFGIA